MSLLLDALKEAEKSRKGLEATAEPTSPPENQDICLDLDLDQLEPTKTDSKKSSSEQTAPKKVLEQKEDQIQEQSPTVKEESFHQTPRASEPEKPPNREPAPSAAPSGKKQALADEPSTPEPSIPDSPVTEINVTDSASGSHKKEEKTPIPATRPKTENRPRIAANVFQNQAPTSPQAETKEKSRILILLLLLLLVLTGLVVMFFILSAEPEPTFPQSRYDREQETTNLAPEADLLSGEAISATALKSATSDNTNINSASPVQPNQISGNDTSPASAKVVENTKKLQTSNDQTTFAPPAMNNLPAAQNQQPVNSSNNGNKLNTVSTVKSGIQISKRKLSTRSQSSLAAAQKALGTGNLNNAEKAYRQAIKESPENITAISALASLLSQQGRTQEAQTLFLKTLKNDPENLVAKTGLINIRAMDPTNLSAGSELKQLLTEHPKQAHLHASLGNFHARRNEWPSAQSAYFEAFALDSESPDYAFNLAISLDQIGKPEIAASYYEKAIKLFGKRPTQFSKADAERRLAELKGLNKTEGLNQSDELNFQKGIAP